MLQTRVLGVFLLSTAGAACWFGVLHTPWGRPLATKGLARAGYALAALPLLVFLLPSSAHPRDPSGASAGGGSLPAMARATVQDTEGGVLSIGQGNRITINQNNPKAMEDINQKLDALLALSDKDIRRLESSYGLGFVLVAFSGEVDATRVKSHTPEGVDIRADWPRCSARRDADGDVVLRLMGLRVSRPGYAPILASDNEMHLRGLPGDKGLFMQALRTEIYVECVQAKPIGICLAVGLARMERPGRGGAER